MEIGGEWGLLRSGAEKGEGEEGGEMHFWVGGG